MQWSRPQAMKQLTDPTFPEGTLAGQSDFARTHIYRRWLAWCLKPFFSFLWQNSAHPIGPKFETSSRNSENWLLNCRQKYNEIGKVSLAFVLGHPVLSQSFYSAWVRGLRLIAITLMTNTVSVCRLNRQRLSCDPREVISSYDYFNPINHFRCQENEQDDLS
jgi:hypothetical protein